MIDYYTNFLEYCSDSKIKPGEKIVRRFDLAAIIFKF